MRRGMASLLTGSMMLLEAGVEDGKGRWEFMSDEIIYSALAATSLSLFLFRCRRSR